MATATTQRRLTPEDLLALADGGKGFELVDGNLVELNVGAESSYIGGSFVYFMRRFQEEHAHGWVFPSDTGYQCFPWAPGLVRKPDASFVRFGRFPNEELPSGYCRIAPDLAVEVVSPHDLAYEVEDKIDEYRRAGIRLTWVAYPSTRTIRLYRADGSFGHVTERDELDGEDVLPGFRRPVRDFFAPRSPAASAGGDTA